MADDALFDVEGFSRQLQGKGRLIGLDLGTKTIGVAVSDALWTVASPLTTVRRKKFTVDATELISLIEEENVAGIVLGWPVNMDGSEGPRCQATRAFARNFTQLHALPLLLWDERLSTVAAERAMLEADLSRAKRAEKIDQVAASIILQAALDRLHQIASA